jgi:hypothetical protein
MLIEGKRQKQMAHNDLCAIHTVLQCLQTTSQENNAIISCGYEKREKFMSEAYGF